LAHNIKNTGKRPILRTKTDPEKAALSKNPQIFG
jgi:hypothetical protein